MRACGIKRVWPILYGPPCSGKIFHILYHYFISYSYISMQAILCPCTPKIPAQHILFSKFQLQYFLNQNSLPLVSSYQFVDFFLQIWVQGWSSFTVHIQPYMIFKFKFSLFYNTIIWNNPVQKCHLALIIQENNKLPSFCGFFVPNWFSTRQLLSLLMP